MIKYLKYHNRKYNTMKSFVRNCYLILLLSVVAKSMVIAQAPNFPVSGVVNVSLPAPVTFEEYANPITTPIDLRLALIDFAIPQRLVFISVVVKGPGISISSVGQRVSHLLYSGTNVIPKAVVASCFTPENLFNLPPNFLQNPMPSGLYSFAFRVTDALTGVTLSPTIESAPVWVEVSDPPVPVAPTNYIGVPATQVQNVVFQWLPRHTPNPNVDYEFTLTELPIANRGNLQNVFLSQPPLFQTTVPIPTLLYDAKYPPLREGAVYAWRVQAKPKFGLAPGKVSAFQNNGYSEIFSFVYERSDKKLNPPTDLQVAYSTDYGSLNMNWKGEDNHFKYEIKISKESEIQVEEDGAMKVYKESKEFDVFEIEKGGGNLVPYIYKHFGSSLLQNNLKIAVRAIDKFGRMSDPVSVNVAPIDKIIFNEVIDRVTTLRGTVEAALLDYKGTTLFDRNPTVIGEKTRMQIAPAAVYLYSSNDKLIEPTIDGTIRDWKDKKPGLKIYKAQVAGDGSYSFDIRLHEVKQYKYQYLLVKTPSSNYYDVINTLDIPQEGLTEKILPVSKTVMKTVQLWIDFIFDENIFMSSTATEEQKKANGVSMDKFEVLNLYRLKSVYEGNNQLLKFEAGDNATVEITYNNKTYIKIGSLIEPSKGITACFSNDIFPDNLIVEAQEFDKDVQFYPVPKFSHTINILGQQNPREVMGSFSIIFDNQPYDYRVMDAKNTPTDKTILEAKVRASRGIFSPDLARLPIKFKAPLVHITGQAASRGDGQTIPAPNLEVGIMVLDDNEDPLVSRNIRITGKFPSANAIKKFYVEEIKTDADGYFRFILPDYISTDPTIKEIIIFNRIPGVHTYYQARSIDNPATNIEYNIDLQTDGTAIASVLKNQNGEPVIGAKLLHSSGAMATTNQNGEFVLSIPINSMVEADPTIQIMANGFRSKKVSVADFQKTENLEIAADLGLSFWNTQMEEVRKLTKGEFEALGDEDAFVNNFSSSRSQLKTFYKKDSIGVIAIQNWVQLKTYILDKNKQKKYVPSNLSLFNEEQAIPIPQNGIVKLLHTNEASLAGEVLNPDSTASVFFVEEKFEIGFDEPATLKDTIKIELMLKKATLVAGIVMGYDSDSVKIDVEEGVTISAEGTPDVTTDEAGRFKIWLEEDAEEVELTLKKESFNDIKFAFTTRIKSKEDVIKDFGVEKNSNDTKAKKSRKGKDLDLVYTTEEYLRNLNLSIYEQEYALPEFATLQGFKIVVEKIIPIDATTFSITGSINVSSENSIFQLVDGEKLSFENIEVGIDENDETNAILVEDQADLMQETLNLKLYDYAKVESNSDENGTSNPIQLVKLNLDGNESYGKIGGASLRFIPSKVLKQDAEDIMQELKLVPKVTGEKDKEYTEEDKEKAEKAKAEKEARAKAIEKKEKAAAKKQSAKNAAAYKLKTARDQKKQARDKERADKAKEKYATAAKTSQKEATKAKATAEKSTEKAAKAKEKIAKVDERLKQAEDKAAKAKDKVAKAKEALAKSKENAKSITGNSLKAKADANKAKAATAKAEAALKKAELEAAKRKEGVAQAKTNVKDAKTDAKKAQSAANLADKKAAKAEEKAAKAEDLAKNGPPAKAVKKDTVEKGKIAGLIEKGKKFANTKGKKMAIAQGKKLLKDNLNPKDEKTKEGEEGEGGEGDEGGEDGEEDEESDEEEEEGMSRKWDYIVPVFVSGGKQLNTFHENVEYQLEYPKEVNGAPRPDQKDFRGKPTGKKETIGLDLGSGFEALLDESQEAMLSREGVFFNGNLGFPEMPKIGVEGKLPAFSKFWLAPKETLPLKELSFNKQPGKPYVVNLGMAKKWALELDKIKVVDDFDGVEFGGRLYLDTLNHLIIHSMALRRVNGTTYPFFDIEFPTEGFKVGPIILKSPNNQHITAGYKEEDNAYEIDAGVRILTTGSNPILRRSLPLEVEKFIYNTSGKFYLSLNVGKKISMGPLKINIRRMIFNKGADVTWNEMLETLKQGTPNFVRSMEKKFNAAGYRTSNADGATKRRRRVSLMPVIDHTPLEDNSRIDWAFGFAGGVEVEKLKGMNAKGDASFVFGEREGDFKIQFNSLQVSLEGSSFKAAMYMEFSYEKGREGFAGEGRVEVAKTEVDAGFKFFKIEQGDRSGIEFGAQFKIGLGQGITTGPLTWTKVGGGIEMNTAFNRYSIFFLGDANLTGVPPDVIKFPNIKIEVLFELEECGILPIIKGYGEVWLKDKKACQGDLIVDLCRLYILINVQCDMDYDLGVGTVKVQAVATLYVSTETFFLAAHIRASLLGINGNLFFAVSTNAKIRGAGVRKEMAYYDGVIESRYVGADGKMPSGILLDIAGDINKSANGKFLFVHWKSYYISSNRFKMFVPFTSLNFQLSNDFKMEAGFGVGLNSKCNTVYGSVKARVMFEGGHSPDLGWYFNGLIEAELMLAMGDTKCNWLNITSGEWKICVGAKLAAGYEEKGRGWHFSLSL